jgi:mono/diheme cytochrome c family protein
MKRTKRGAAGLGLALFVTAAAANGDRGAALFAKDATPPCGVCHTLTAAGTTGNIGPSLEEMKPGADRVARVIRSGIGAMPAYPNLSDADVKALAEFVARATRGAK